MGGLLRESVQSFVASLLDDILELAAAELTLQETGGTITTDGTEQTLYINNGPLGTFRPVCVFLNLDAMQGGDTVDVKVYYRLASGGALALTDYYQYTGADGGLANGRVQVVLDLDPNRFGVQVTIQRTAGSDRAFVYEVFVEN